MPGYSRPKDGVASARLWSRASTSCLYRRKKNVDAGHRRAEATPVLMLCAELAPPFSGTSIRRRRSLAYGPAIHIFLRRYRQDVDARDIGERKRRRPSDGYNPGMTNSDALHGARTIQPNCNHHGMTFGQLATRTN